MMPTASAELPNQLPDPLLENLSQQLTYFSDEQRQSILDAYAFSKAAHQGQYRRSGEAYITHPVAVAEILAEMKMDAQSLMAALLHDVIEDCLFTKEDIANEFGSAVAELVDGVSKISAIHFESRKVQQAENFRKMVLAMTKDIRVILVKLSDRLHNMRTLQVLNPEKRRRIATETLEIYAPIANRLGMNNIRVEFEDLGLAALYPMRTRLIQKAVKKARGHRKEIIHTIEAAIQQRLAQENLTARVIGREKHLYSIYQKMKTQRKSFAQIMDVYGFRIVTDSVDTCYRILGAIHNLYKPIPGRFKDYIAIPKANGYQSLHTTLKGSSGVPIEIQIRTEDMDAMASNGIAAHWLYKSDAHFTEDAQSSRAREWLKGLLELQKSAGNSLEFIESVKIDLFPDEVYVFTPKGHILELPTGATAIDFAYTVHTDVGNHCIAARIDSRLAPLSSVLQSGQTIEIITTKNACPNPLWLSFAVTGRARASIRHALKHQKRSESVALGKNLLEKALNACHKVWQDITAEKQHLLLKDTALTHFDDLLEQIGLGNRIAPLIARRLINEETTDETPITEPSPLMITGTEGLVVTFAKCCRPIPGDPIIGFLSSGRGMVIHVDSCRNLSNELKEHPDKCLTVKWATKTEGEFLAALRIETENKRGVLANIATIISDSGASIESLNLGEKDAQLCSIHIVLGVKNRIHLARVIKRLRAAQATIKIFRVKH